MRKTFLFALFMIFLSGSLYASPQDRLDTWKKRSDWPFEFSDKEISMGYLNDALTTDLTEGNIAFIRSIGEQFLEDLTVWKAAQQNPSLKNHKNFAAFDKEVRNCNEVRKQISEYMQYDFLVPLNSLKMISYEDGSVAIAKGSDGKYVKELGEEYITKLKRYAKQVAPFFGGENDPQGKYIIDQVALVVRANEGSKKIISKAQADKKREREKKQQELAKTEKYDPQKTAINSSDAFISQIRKEYQQTTKNSPDNIIDISPLKYKEYMDYTGGALSVAECIAKNANYKEKYDVQGVLLAKENGKYVKYTFWSVKSIDHVYNGSSYSNPSQGFYTEVVKKCEVQPANVASKYKK